MDELITCECGEGGTAEHPGTCRQFVLKLKRRRVGRANFRFKDPHGERRAAGAPPDLEEERK